MINMLIVSIPLLGLAYISYKGKRQDDDKKTALKMRGYKG